MSEINKILLERNAKEAKEAKEIESQYQKEGTITFDVYDDDDFIILLVSLLREKVRQQEIEKTAKRKEGDNIFNINLIVLNNFIEKMKIAAPSLSKGVITSFVMAQKPKEEPKHYGKLCKACGYNIKAYYGKKENPCHRCGEVN